MIHHFAGARWWKFDFHAHTPASRCRAAKPWRDAVGTPDEVTPEKLMAVIQVRIERYGGKDAEILNPKPQNRWRHRRGKDMPEICLGHPHIKSNVLERFASSSNTRPQLASLRSGRLGGIDHD